MQTITSPAITTGDVIARLAATLHEIDALDTAARKSPEGQRAYIARGALETLLTTAKPATPAEALAVLTMAGLQVHRMIHNTTGESRKELAFKASAALREAGPVLAQALVHTVGADVLAIVERYLLDVPEPVEPAAAA